MTPENGYVRFALNKNLKNYLKYCHAFFTKISFYLKNFNRNVPLNWDIQKKVLKERNSKTEFEQFNSCSKKNEQFIARKGWMWFYMVFCTSVTVLSPNFPTKCRFISSYGTNSCKFYKTALCDVRLLGILKQLKLNLFKRQNWCCVENQ